MKIGGTNLESARQIEFPNWLTENIFPDSSIKRYISRRDVRFGHGITLFSRSKRRKTKCPILPCFVTLLLHRTRRRNYEAKLLALRYIRIREGEERDDPDF